MTLYFEYKNQKTEACNDGCRGSKAVLNGWSVCGQWPNIDNYVGRKIKKKKKKSENEEQE